MNFLFDKNILKNRNLSFSFICMSLLLLCVASSCSTKKNTLFYRAYHGTTARFNILFNGTESYKEAIEVLDASVVDNYTTILPVFPLPPKTTALQSAPQLDRSIEKASKAIKKHSMFIKGVERCKPIDDAYLLMGKAYYQRQDFPDAMSVFDYVVNTHKSGNVWPDAFTWKARTNLAMDRMDEAEVCLEEGKVPVSESKDSKHRQHWEATYAEFLLKQKDYEMATIYLSELLKHKHLKKDFKTRVHFILGQTYQELGQNRNAAEQYAKVLKKNPTYEMDFNATLNLALCSANDEKSKTLARERLKKLLKDPINEHYKDQIFYAFAQLDLMDEDVLSAISNLEASVYWSISNDYQKTVSALQLAELYFERSQFVESQKYYEEVVNIIPQTFPDYAEIKERAAILKNLVENLMHVQTQDSLQRMARMTEDELNAYVDKLIVDYNEQEAARIADEEKKAQMMETSKKSRDRQLASASSDAWAVFYNPTQVRQGQQEFRKQWGTRSLEDYWFLADIDVVDMFADNSDAQKTESENEDNGDEKTSTQQESSSKGRTTNPQNRNYYLQDVPFTEEQLLASNELIATGLYNSGIIYSDDLYDYPKAVKQWEEFLLRFPDHKFKAPICFQLYETYAYLKDNDKSEYYKDIILREFPNSNYAKIIQDPNYYKEVALKSKDGENFYISVYNAFVKEDYANTIRLANTGLEKYPTPTLAPKFDYLKAISKGKLHGNDTLRVLLTNITKNYPGTAIDTAATNILEAMKRLQSQQTTQTPVGDTAAGPLQRKDVPVYTYDATRFHFVIIVANIKDVKINELKGHLNNFNNEFFRLQKLDVSSFYLDSESAIQMVTIDKFDNKSKAMDYYNVLNADKKHVGYLQKAANTKIYVISDNNYTTYYRQKDKRDLYDEFFKEYYLK